jgi:hypothetical protein
MVLKLLNRARQLVTTGVQVLQNRLRSWTKPSIPSLTVGSIHDLARSKPQLVIENALLRQVGRRDVFQHPTPQWSGVGRRRGPDCAGLFRRPLPEPRLQAFPARGSPVIYAALRCRVGRPAWMAS